MNEKHGPRQKDYPKELLIGDAIYRIRFVKKIDPTKKVVGLCDPCDKEILILQGLSPLERFKSFIHEILHALEYEYEIKMDHSLIYKLEEPIAFLLLDNILTVLR
jgi:hypothetical protein